ncbi:hypothetical protein HS7_04630 [Sulfolobales archaeon HS-7]|nr:hypothetical protein HS7_04630 [Sulfolobales archaeon HS-7]
MLISKKKDKVVHISELPEVMISVLKSVIDAAVPDLPKLFGFKYYLPLPGEQAVIPYAELEEKFRDAEHAYDHFIAKLDEIVEKGIQHFSSMYKDSAFVPFFRVSYYSMVDRKNGMISGIAVDPTGDEGDPFKLRQKSAFLAPLITGKRILIANPIMGGYVYNRNSPLWALAPSEVRGYDDVSARENDIVSAYMDVITKFHEGYDKDKNFNRTLSEKYMRRGFSTLTSSLRQSGYTEDLDFEPDVIILPFRFVKKELRTSTTDILEGWNENKYYHMLLEVAKYLELEVWTIVEGYQYINDLVKKLEKKFSGKAVIVLSDTKMPKLRECKSCEEIPSSLTEYEIESDEDEYKIIRLR